MFLEKPLTLWELMVMVEVVGSILGRWFNGIAIRDVLPEVTPDDKTLGPENRIFDFLDVLFLDRQLEALESVVPARNLFKIHNTNILSFYSRLHIVHGCIDVDVADVEVPGEIRTSPRQESLGNFLAHDDVARLSRVTGEARTSM